MEWPDKVAGQLPPPDWVMAIETEDESSRRVQVHAGTERGAAWLDSAHRALWLEGPHAL
jgi:tRNA threonylcarbamoyladenosine biosynthesis protein TsaE